MASMVFAIERSKALPLSANKVTKDAKKLHMCLSRQDMGMLRTSWKQPRKFKQPGSQEREVLATRASNTHK